jgi:hypothetical protein
MNVYVVVSFIFLIILALIMLTSQYFQFDFLMTEVEPISKFYSNPDIPIQSLDNRKVLLFSIGLSAVLTGIIFYFFVSKSPPLSLKKKEIK